MKAILAVAHPDDCVIFAWPFIEAHPEVTWTILYLTYTPWEPRAKEMLAFWDNHNVRCIFLGYQDSWESVKNGKLGFDSIQADRELANIVSEYDLVLTHYEDGDYGHIHHKFVNTAVNKTSVPKVYFASTFNYNTKYQAINPINTADFPLHQEVIEGFQNRNTGLYIATLEAVPLIKRTQ